MLGSTRSGSGATAIATISGGLSNVSLSNQGSGYNQADLPTCIVTLPDFIDITLENVLGNFLPDEIIIGKEKFKTTAPLEVKLFLGPNYIGIEITTSTKYKNRCRAERLHHV